MEISDLNNLWKVVETTGKSILVIEFFGETRSFLLGSFSPKTRDVFFNEVRDAIDITDITIHLPFQVSESNPITIDDRIHQRSKKDFKFGHDSYIWMIAK